MSFEDGLSSIPLIGGIFDDSEEKALNELKKNKALYDMIGLPQSAWETFNPEDYKAAGSLTPEAAQYQTTSEDPLTRSAQMSALAKMAGLSETGLSAVDDEAFAKAENMGARQARSSRESALQNAQARGIGGSGLEFAMREMGDEGGAQRAQDAALSRAAEAAKERALYTQAYGSQLAGMRDQDYRAASNNTDIINKFNQYNTAARNDAQQWNLNNQQTVANNNTQGHNQAQQYNQQGRRDIGQRAFDNSMRKADSQAGLNQKMADYYWDKQAKNQASRAAIGQAAGTGIGFAAGGPAGAKAGGAIGGGIGGAF
jgi:hypothetical protein